MILHQLTDNLICEMKYKVNEAIQILEKTPLVLKSLLSELNDKWIYDNEGERSWSPFDIVGHLIHGEKTDWLPRIKIILGDNDRHFDVFDRFAQFENSKGKTINELLTEFEILRIENISLLKSLNISEKDLEKTGIHPELGLVTLREHLSTWVVHDLSHLSQITRVMAKQYKQEMGPWIKYFQKLKD